MIINILCFTTNEDGWTSVRGKVNRNILTIEAHEETCEDTISWMVIGERKDPHMINTDWTDENGKIIVEPEKTNLEPMNTRVVTEIENPVVELQNRGKL